MMNSSRNLLKKLNRLKLDQHSKKEFSKDLRLTKLNSKKFLDTLNQDRRKVPNYNVVVKDGEIKVILLNPLYSVTCKIT